MLRACGPKGSQGARYGSAVAIIEAIHAPINYLATELWRTAHSALNVSPMAEAGSLESRMEITLLVSTISFMVRFPFMLTQRYTLRRAEAAVDELYRDAA